MGKRGEKIKPTSLYDELSESADRDGETGGGESGGGGGAKSGTGYTLTIVADAAVDQKTLSIHG